MTDTTEACRGHHGPNLVGICALCGEPRWPAGAIADFAISLIKIDSERGQVDLDHVATFSGLHDQVDANEYLIEGAEQAGLDAGGNSQAELDVFNDACDIINKWLTTVVRS